MSPEKNSSGKSFKAVQRSITKAYLILTSKADISLGKKKSLTMATGIAGFSLAILFFTYQIYFTKFPNSTIPPIKLKTDREGQSLLMNKGINL